MSETSNKTRLEHDCIGQMEVPANVYWGIHTQRAIGNFPVSGITDSQHPELIRAYATVKRACAIANEELGLIDPAKAEAIRESWLAGYVTSDYRIPMLRAPRGRKEQQYQIAGNKAARIAWQIYAKAVIDILHYGPERLERLRKESHANYEQLNQWAHEDGLDVAMEKLRRCAADAMQAPDLEVTDIDGSKDAASMTITNNTFTMPDENVEVKAIFEKNTSTGGGGGGGVTTYPITVKSAKNGDVTASHKSASKGTTVTLTVDPDKGYVLDTLTVLDGKDKDLKLTEKNGKFTFTMPASKVTVAATFKASAPTGKNPFVDVPAGSYYEDAVVWAVGKGITTGMSAAAFDPNGSCTRAQIVTFLWRAAGSPEPKTMKGFDDVASNAYYAKAVAWAVENGITTGTSASKFSPNDPCTRTQAVTFLFRYAAANGMEAVTMQELLSGYADAASVPSYAVSAMNWALAAGILQGDGVKLMPNATCTRAQVVTFLYRAMK